MSDHKWCVALAALWCVSGSAVGQEVWALRHKLLASDAQANSEFGSAVGMNADMAVVGSYLADDRDRQLPSAGSVYVYDLITGSQLLKLNAINVAAGEYFGSSIGVDGDLAVIGARNNSERGSGAGAAYLFELSTGRPLFQFKADDGNDRDQFGNSVAISGPWIVIGAVGDAPLGPNSGAAYIFDSLTGQQVRKVFPSDGRDGDVFGCSVGVSGDLAIIGAYQDNEHGNDSGSAYLYDVTTGQQLYKIIPSDGQALDGFGFSVAIEGHLAIIGAYNDDDPQDGSGSAYVYDVTTGEQVWKFTPPDGEVTEWFGWSVALSGDRAIVGARYDNDLGYRSGSAYVFDLTTGDMVHKLRATDGGMNHNFGAAVGIRNNWAVAGAWGSNDRGTRTGAAYLFEQRFADYHLEVTGMCPGVVTVSWLDATPSNVQALFYALGVGALNIPNGNPCGGVRLGLSPSQFQLVTPPGPFSTGVAGMGSISGPVSSGACGGALQLLDVATCVPSNVDFIPH